ncbi:MAG: hypothetical protein VKL42_01775, partial [Snowella sp.]|nr:hypothetical protein [Snowella sp.]
MSKLFKPSKKMREILKIALTSDKVTISSWFKEAGYNHASWYKWNKKPEFIAWWAKEWEAGMVRNVTFLDKIGVSRAKAGDFRFWEAMQK